ncbi:MAG: deoxyguanosinetriphosphate triphosphohydrolase [Gammaproteobacteria bacterium]|nr:deoxyguanosinetriphosphate triphosphohydrolase [Gammaproteobacteria bacterium]MCP5200749.1 deoxyguanosinetriphosphate triphosphohydrolase [Gammaproteobacteria bacterium]
MTLAAYAVTTASSRGRRFAESPPTWRDEFQRDRDRVIHSSAFRRLEYKTQVFVNHEGDMFRTRLTHSLEVTQIARTVARALGVNEDLTEAITLAHDLGHTPFGHAGQAALNDAMRPFGGFEHNLHSLRVVDQLEARYAAFDGLNLMFETREGILKHCRPDKARELGAVAERFLSGQQATVEAQIANVADEIAYNHHDIDDGLRSGILSFDAIAGHPVFGQALADCRAVTPNLTGKRLIYTAIRSMLGLFANDLIAASRARLATAGCASTADVRALPHAVVALSPDVQEHHLSLKRLLHRELYSDPRVREFTNAGARTVDDLFARYTEEPGLLPPERRPPPGADEAARARAVADYIAGMTDRFAIAEHRRLVGHDYWPDGRAAH